MPSKWLPRNLLRLWLVAVALGSGTLFVSAQQGLPVSLRIVVIEGEGAVNIIQQKTAVAPLVEVRDRNDQPVAGAVVRFAIQRGKASFGGATSLSVITDASGRAAAAGFSPTASGGLRIVATATAEGHTATATIAQTTVATAAEASSAIAGVGAGTNGGTSNLAIVGIVGGAGAGILGAALVSRDSGGPAQAPVLTLAGPVDGAAAATYRGADGGTCTTNHVYAGTLRVTVRQQRPTVAGVANLDYTLQYRPGTCGTPAVALAQFRSNGALTGTADALHFKEQVTGNFTSPGSGGFVQTQTVTFDGVIRDIVTGVLTIAFHEDFATGLTMDSTVAIPVTLR